MPDEWSEAVDMLRSSVTDRIQSLEQAVATDEGTPNLLRSVTERVTIDDSVTVSTESTSSLTWNQDQWQSTDWQ